MARGTPTFNSGSLVAAGSGQVDNLYNVVRTQLTNYQSNGVNAWQEIDSINTTPGTQNRVFHTVGDRTLGADVVSPYFGNGDIDHFIRIHNSAATTIVFVAYQDWSPTSSAGNRPNGVNTYLNWTSLSDTDALDWWCIGNEYEFVFIFKQGGITRWVVFGVPRRWATPGISGVGRVATQTSATGTITIALDRDISSLIVPGQTVWLINRTPSSTALVSDYTELVTVTAVSATPDITVSGVSNQPYEVGALVGLDPSPQYSGAGTGTGDPTILMTNRPDGGYTGTQVQIAGFDILPVNESSVDPNFSQLYHGFKPVLNGGQAGFEGPRGYPEFIAFWALGAQNDADRMLPEYDTAQAYKIFPSLPKATFAASIGPGAT
jgi:hypothetical protein